MPRTATIGPQIFERVNALVADGKSRTEAFAQIGEERKSRPGTVAANYYRVARAQGKTTTQRRRTKTATTKKRAVSTQARRAPARRTAAASADSDLRQIAEQIASLTAQLVRHVEERDAQIRSLLG
jgi:transcription initiation factor TFIIIB Brf1 subunit/transcription initiation factor TFIIB